MKQKVRAPASRPNSDSAPRATVLARHTDGAPRRHTGLISPRRGDDMDSAHLTPSKQRSRRWRDPLEAIDATLDAIAAAATAVDERGPRAFDVQDTEAWSNADDLRTPRKSRPSSSKALPRVRHGQDGQQES